MQKSIVLVQSFYFLLPLASHLIWIKLNYIVWLGKIGKSNFQWLGFEPRVTRVDNLSDWIKWNLSMTATSYFKKII